MGLGDLRLYYDIIQMSGICRIFTGNSEHNKLKHLLIKKSINFHTKETQVIHMQFKTNIVL